MSRDCIGLVSSCEAGGFDAIADDPGDDDGEHGDEQQQLDAFNSNGSRRLET